MHNKRIVPAIIGAGGASIVLLADQCVKFYIRWYLADFPIVVLPQDMLSIVYYKNTGIALGIPFPSELLLVIIACIIVGLVYYFRKRLDEYRIVLPLALVIGGAFGNAVDRVLLGYVLDYIQIWMFPVFNFADACIVIGICWIAYYELFSKQKERAQ